MMGEAGRLVRDIEVAPVLADGNPDPAFTIEQLLNRYEEQFMPPAQSDLSISTFEAATQEAKETPIMWAARIKELFQRAYPDGNIVNDRQLINRFTCGLRVQEVAAYVHEQRPATFEAASQAAQTKTASRQFLHSQWTGRRGTYQPGGGVNAIGQRGDDACRYCKDKGHWERECPKKKRGSGRKNQKGGNRQPSRRVQQIGDADEEDPEGDAEEGAHDMDEAEESGN